jgi:HlyD family secretion protein
MGGVKNCKVIPVSLHLPLLGKVRRPAPWIWGVVSVGILGIGAGTFVWARNNAAPVNLTDYTISVKPEALTLRITASGSVVPVQSVNLSPKTAGVLKELIVEQGDRVVQGQVIARMDQQDLRGQLLQEQGRVDQARARLEQLKNGSRPEEIEQARARLDQSNAALAAAKSGNRKPEISQAQAQVVSAQAKLDLANSKKEQYTKLKDAGAIALERFNEVEADAKTADASLADARQRLKLLQEGSRTEDIQKAQANVREFGAGYALARNGTRAEEIAQAQAQLTTALGQLEVAQTRLADTVIRAPFAGVVTQKYATEGAFVTPTTSASSTTSATSTSIVAVAKDLEILAKVPEVDIGQIRSGQPVEIKVDSYPTQTFKGRVRLVSPEAVVEQSVTSFQVRVAILTGQRQLLSGMNSDLTFLGKTIPDALVVPTVAIATIKGQTGVYIPDKENKPKFQSVTIGSTVQNKTQIVEGLGSGQKVFIDFPKNLKPKELEEPST